MLHFSINWTFKMRYHINFYLTWHRNYQTNKMQSNYFIKIGLPRGLSFWAVPAATPIESNFTKKRPTELSVKSIDVKINCLPYQNWFFKLYMLNKKDIVAFYHTEIVKVFIFLTLRLISIFFCTEICPGFAMEQISAGPGVILLHLYDFSTTAL